MQCEWKTFTCLLPHWMRQQVELLGKETLQELRLRLNYYPRLITVKGIIDLDKTVTSADLQFCVNMASQYSPWSASSIKQGYVTAEGGHRVGVCGIALQDTNCGIIMQSVTSVCVRVARDFSGISNSVESYDKSILIIGSPGSGKTTLLRDLIRKRSNSTNASVAVIDEKAEIFPHYQGRYCFDIGKNTDILSGYRKDRGIDVLLRNMGPGTIAVDEITAETDCDALVRAGWCGVKLLATAHAETKRDLYMRSVYQPIVNCNLFDLLIVMHKDKSWHIERMNQ